MITRIEIVNHLHELIRSKKFDECIKVIIELPDKDKAEILNTVDNLPRTLLAAALSAGHVGLVKFLLENGADATAVDFRYRKSMLDYIQQTVLVNLILPRIKKWVDECQIDSKTNDKTKIKYTLLAFSCANMCLLTQDIENSKKYFKAANRVMTKLSNPSLLTQAAFQWRIFHYQAIANQNDGAGKEALENSLKAYTKATQLDETNRVFEEAAIEDTLAILLQIPSERIGKYENQFADVFKVYFSNKLKKMSFEATIDELYQYIMEIIDVSASNRIQELLEFVATYLHTRYESADINLEQKLKEYTYIAEKLNSLARILEDIHPAAARHVYIYSNKFIDQVEQLKKDGLAPKLKIIKNINLKKIAYIDKISEVYMLFSRDMQLKNMIVQGQYAKYLAIVEQQIAPIYTDLSKNSSRIPLENLKKLMQCYIKVTLDNDNRITHVDLAKKRLNTDLLTEDLQQFFKNASLFFQVSFLSAGVDNLLNWHETFVPVADQFLKFNLEFKNISKIKLIESLMVILNDICIAEIEFLKQCYNTESEKYLQKKGLDLLILLVHKINNLINVNNSESAHLQKLLKQCVNMVETNYKKYWQIAPSCVETMITLFLCGMFGKVGEVDKANEYILTVMPRIFAQAAEFNVEKALLELMELLHLTKKNNLNLYQLHASGKINIYYLIDLSKAVGNRIKYNKSTQTFKSEALVSLMNFWINQLALVKDHDLALKIILHVVKDLHPVFPDLKEKMPGMFSTLTQRMTDYLEHALTATQLDDKQSKEIIANLSTCITLLTQAKKEKKLYEIIKFVGERSDELKKLHLDYEALSLVFDVFYKKDIKFIDQAQLHQLKFTYLQSCIDAKDVDFFKMKEALKSCFQYYSSPSSNNKPENHESVILQAYVKLATWYEEQGKLNAALDCYNMLNEFGENIHSPQHQDLVRTTLIQANQLMFKMAKDAPLEKAIVLYNDIIDNYEYLDDQTSQQLALQKKIDCEFALIKQHITHAKFNDAKCLCKELLQQDQILTEEQQNQVKYLYEVTLSKEMEWVKDARSMHSMFSNNVNNNNSPSPRKSNKGEVEKEEQPVTNQKKTVTISAPVKPSIAGARVGAPVSAKNAPTMNLFPVLRDDIAEFNKLKETDYLTYSGLSQMVFEGGVCRKKGEFGLKQLSNGFWEAKWHGKARLRGQIQNIQGVNCIVFDTFARNGYGHNKKNQ